MTIIEVINKLKNQLKQNGNLDVKILKDGDYVDFCFNDVDDMIDIGGGEYVPVPILLIDNLND